MQRRRFIATASSLGVTAAAGCLGDDGGASTPTPSTTMADTSFSVQGIESGTEVDEATVTFDGTTVTVEGTIWGADGCTTAELAGADYDADADELTVAVATTEAEATEDRACTQAIVEIDYQAIVEFQGGLPSDVIVTHSRGGDSKRVATASP